MRSAEGHGGGDWAEGGEGARAPLLFERRWEERKRCDPILPAKPSASAQRKKRSWETAEGLPVHSFEGLLRDLASQDFSLVVQLVKTNNSRRYVPGRKVLDLGRERPLGWSRRTALLRLRPTRVARTGRAMSNREENKNGYGTVGCGTCLGCVSDQ